MKDTKGKTMQIFENWMMASDIDGTLVGDDCKLHEQDIYAIQFFIENGGTFVLTTGRSAYCTKTFYQQLNLTSPVICNNGTTIKRGIDRENLYINALDPENSDITSLIQYVIDGFPQAGIEIYSSDDIYLLRHNEVVAEHIRREKLNAIPYTLKTAPQPWCKVLFAIAPPLMNDFRNFIDNSPYKANFLFSQSAPFFYEVCNQDASKGTAVAYLAEHLGIPKTNIITIGDNENDAQMLALTQHSFAVKNASEYAKANAKHQTAVSGLDGGAVAEAIETTRTWIQSQAVLNK